MHTALVSGGARSLTPGSSRGVLGQGRCTGNAGTGWPLVGASAPSTAVPVALKPSCSPPISLYPVRQPVLREVPQPQRPHWAALSGALFGGHGVLSRWFAASSCAHTESVVEQNSGPLLSWLERLRVTPLVSYMWNVGTLACRRCTTPNFTSPRRRWSRRQQLQRQRGASGSRTAPAALDNCVYLHSAAFLISLCRVAYALAGRASFSTVSSRRGAWNELQMVADCSV
jgi:hypothetical protein